MDKETYHLKLENLMDKIKNLTVEVQNSDDDEKIKYLKLALKSVHEEIRLLMDSYHKI
jgi:hypothetical protein